MNLCFLEKGTFWLHFEWSFTRILKNVKMTTRNYNALQTFTRTCSHAADKTPPGYPCESDFLWAVLSKTAWLLSPARATAFGSHCEGLLFDGSAKFKISSHISRPVSAMAQGWELNLKYLRKSTFWPHSSDVLERLESTEGDFGAFSSVAGFWKAECPLVLLGGER